MCSTHILKFETQKLSNLVLNEYLSMQLAKRLKYLIGKLVSALQEEMDILINDKEKEYLKKYQDVVIKRCKHLLEQSDLITTVAL